MKKIYIFLIAVFTFSANSFAQILSESFDATAFPPTGWTNTEVVGTISTDDVWVRATTSTQTNPNNITPHSGAGMALYDAYNYEDGSIADLATPALNLTAGSYRVSFWMYRDQRYTFNEDSIVVYVSSSAPVAAGGTRLGKIIRNYTFAPAEAAVGWYQYSFNIPSSFNTSTNYVIFNAYSSFGTEMLIDDVLVELQPSCQAPSTITPAPVNTTSVTLSWPAVSGALGYQYVLNSLLADPTGAGTSVATNSTTIAGTYTLGTTYYAHVRTACAGATFSAWKTIAVIIPPTCTSNLLPANMATGLDNPINLSWTASVGATSYNVFLSSDNGVTYTNVGNIAGTTAILTLVSTGTFYWYVQPSNGGVASGCQASATSFTTSATPANDLCSGATVIPCGGSISGNNGFATNDALPAITCGSTTATVGNNRGVWFKVTPTLSGSLTVSACVATTFDTYMRVYDGACGAFTSCVGFNDDGCSSQSTLTFTAVAGTTYYILLGGYGATNFGAYTISATCPALCPAPTAVTIGAITLTSASVSWTGGGTNIVEYGPTGFTPGTGATAGGGGTIFNPSTSPQAITGLANSTAYQVYVRQDCTGASNGYSTNSIVASFTTLAPPPVNDEATGAIALTVGGTCTGAIYNNISATQSALEPFPSCKGTAGYSGMWYKFVAPASGSVKVSCDEAIGTFGDSRMALYSATNAADYTTFNVIACDDDNGAITGARSLFYYSGLTAGTTYYVLVDLYSSSSSRGSYCVTVDELSNSMLANTAAGCDVGSTLSNYNAAYTGWLSFVDATGKLNANVRQTAGTATDFDCSRTITTGAPRIDGLAQPYLNRNFLISATGATSADVQLFFLNTEVTALGGTIAGYNVTRVAGSTCNANFTGVGTLLTQTANGTVNGVSYIQVTTPGFSNFYIQNSLNVLPVSIEFFKAAKQGTTNNLDWKVSCTSAPSVELNLERSADGRNFIPINYLNASATRCLQGFNYTDVTPLVGANYYRLKITTPDGQFRYSSIVVLLNKEKGFELISVAPNPVLDRAILTLTSVKGGKVDISISDLAGKTVAKESVQVIAGNNPIPLNVGTLGAGTYTITAINADGEIKNTRFVKF
jgi:hypothetical protein